MGRPGAGYTLTYPGHLFPDNHICNFIGANASVFLGISDTEVTQLPHTPKKMFRKGLGPFSLIHQRSDFRLAKSTYLVFENIMFFFKIRFHIKTPVDNLALGKLV